MALREEIIKDVSSVLYLPPSECALLLRHFKWRAMRLKGRWFGEEDQVREDAHVHCKGPEALPEEVFFCQFGCLFFSRPKLATAPYMPLAQSSQQRHFARFTKLQQSPS